MFVGRRRETREPTHQFTFSGVRGKLPQIDDFRRDRHVHSKYAERLRAILKSAAARACGLKARQQNRVSRIWSPCAM